MKNRTPEFKKLAAKMALESSVKEVASTFEIREATLRNWVKKMKESGDSAFASKNKNANPNSAEVKEIVKLKGMCQEALDLCYFYENRSEHLEKIVHAIREALNMPSETEITCAD